MKKRADSYTYTGSVDSFLSHKIYINVSYLKKGAYEINIVYKGKIIKKVHFNQD